MANQRILYHFSPIRLAPGSVVAPGNWGRILKCYFLPYPDGRSLGNPWVMARELEFEMVREAQFSGRPSRLKSAFCCPDVPNARAYQTQADQGGIQLLHGVELVDSSLPTHQAPVAMVDLPPGGTRFLGEVEMRAHLYWAGHSDGVQEIITESALRVVANID